MQLHVETFLGGLKPELKNKILPFDLQMVVGVKKLALIHKQKLSDLHRVLRQRWIGDSSVGDMEQKLPPGALQLSLDEQLKRKEAGLCFNCNEKFHRVHNCKKASKIFFFETGLMIYLTMLILPTTTLFQSTILHELPCTQF